MTVLLMIIASMHRLYDRQMLFADFQDNERFLSIFLRDKMLMIGNASCESLKPSENGSMIHVYDATEAKHILGLVIKPASNVMQLQECIRLHNRQQFLPVAFFVANSTRMDAFNNPIDSLFMKISDHRREELVPGLSQFNVELILNKQANPIAIRIDYRLKSVLDNHAKQSGILFMALRYAE